MTQEKLKQAEELNKKIKKISSFLSYLEKDNYKVSVHLDNDNEDNFHSEVLHLKNDDELINIIKNDTKSKIEKLKEQFENL